jgi:hypothetical protein
MWMTMDGARRTLAPACAAILLGCAAAIGCGCGESAPPGLATADVRALDEGIAAIEAGAARREKAVVLRRITSLGTRIRRLAAGGALSSSQTQALLRGVAQARAAASAELRPRPGGSGGDHGHGHGNDGGQEETGGEGGD